MSAAPIPQERDQIRAGAFAAVTVLSVVVIAVAVAAVRGILSTHHVAVAPPIGSVPREIGAETPIDTTAIEVDDEGLRIRAAQRARLESYGWVDRQAGIAHIPIDRAMDLVVEEAGR